MAEVVQSIVLFGAHSNLAQLKLFPAIYQLFRYKLVPPDIRIFALARREESIEEFQYQLTALLRLRVREDEMDEEALATCVSSVEYVQVDFKTPEHYGRIREKLETLPEGPVIFYYSIAASLYGDVCDNLSTSGCIDDLSRVVVEKPIGYDLESSKVIEDQLAKYFTEDRIYRIDHYLGKETVQNLLALRFANSLFEVQWNQRYVSHVEITVAEEVGVEGRFSYYDQAGQVRDMLQSHLLQLLCLIAMDPPADLSADSIRDEKLKVLKALKPICSATIDTHVVRGQYAEGTIKGETVPGYTEEEGADPDSQTGTYVAVKAELKNWRWAGVPFYLRTGKRMKEKLSEIVIHFKAPAHFMFSPDQEDIAHNKLVIRIQPDEGISLDILSKDSGFEKGMRLVKEPLNLSFVDNNDKRIPDAYERLFWEVIKGNQYLFVRRDEIEAAWRWCDEITGLWQNMNSRPKTYPAGSWGPAAAIALISRDGRAWHEDL